MQWRKMQSYYLKLMNFLKLVITGEIYTTVLFKFITFIEYCWNIIVEFECSRIVLIAFPDNSHFHLHTKYFILISNGEYTTYTVTSMYLFSYKSHPE